MLQPVCLDSMAWIQKSRMADVRHLGVVSQCKLSCVWGTQKQAAMSSILNSFRAKCYFCTILSKYDLEVRRVCLFAFVSLCRAVCVHLYLCARLLACLCPPLCSPFMLACVCLDACQHLPAQQPVLVNKVCLFCLLTFSATS